MGLVNPVGNLPNVWAIEFGTLKTEIVNDPAGVGYPPWPSDGTAEEKFAAAKQIAALLTHRPKVPNPQPPEKVPKPLDAEQLYQVLTQVEIQAIPADAFDMIHAAIEVGDRARVKRLLNIALKKGWIGLAKHDAIVAEVDTMVDDPDWPAEVLGENRLTATLGRVVGGIAPAEVQYIMETK